ncbi:MAG: PEGA domain-containing protein [Methanoregulaceae archaeon]|nr:MAG: PEGA domain-containing protein [Methanoregulaceae archaeon]
MKPLVFLLLIGMISIVAVPAMAVSAENYMGGDIQIGGSGPNTIRITGITTAVTQAVAGTATTGSLTVTTNPMGAAIHVDGLQRGVSPYTITGLEPGEHTILLKLNGYTDLTAKVTITAGQMTVYTTDLSRPASTPLPALPAATKSPGFEAIPGLAVLGTVLAVRGYRR